MKQIKVETSARHIHLSKADLQYLFGEDFVLEIKKELSQPGQYATNSRLDVVGPKNTIKNVIILGPTRNQTQVEVSLSDTRTLGVIAPVRESGDLKDSASITIRNPENGKEVCLVEGLIVAKRHIHMTPNDAIEHNVHDTEIVNVKIEGNGGRTTIFGDVVVRVSPSYALAMHIDTDESNACNAGMLALGEIIKND